MDKWDVGEWDKFNERIINEFRANEGEVAAVRRLPDGLDPSHRSKSGTEQVSPLACFPEDGGSMLIIASKAGAPGIPDWYHNVKANPNFTVELGTETFRVHAEEVVGPERDEFFARVAAERPNFADYQQKTTRQIPVLRLTPVS